jgi:uroporphyrinogen decarboxylase
MRLKPSPSPERVMAAVNFRQPDRLPRWDNFDIFGDFSSRWRAWKGFTEEIHPVDFYNIDISMTMAEEGPFISQRGVIGQDGDYEIFRDSWGRTVRQKPSTAYFMETIETVLSDPSDLDRLKFEDPSDNRRYQKYVKTIETERQAGRLAFSKIGGIYCRSQFMRREDLLLMDMATDEGFCHALFSKVADYLTKIALEELRRTDSWETGIWVYDDSANSRAPMFSPAMWEKYLLPLYRRMIDALRRHGCEHVFFHSDGNIKPLVDNLLAAGFEGLNPLEPRCGLDLIKLRKRYNGKIVFFGGVCNTEILPRGDRKEIEAHVRPLIELGSEGGLVIGMASIGDDITPETYDYYISLLDKYANYKVEEG